jgi:hypothetical protein
MPKKALSLLVSGLLLQTVFCFETAFASSEAEKQAQFAKKVKAGIGKLGVGREARVEIKLRDKTKLVGYVNEVNENSFVVTNPITDASTTVAYCDVVQVKGHNLSQGAIVTIAVVALVVVLSVIVAANRH